MGGRAQVGGGAGGGPSTSCGMLRRFQRPFDRLSTRKCPACAGGACVYETGGGGMDLGEGVAENEATWTSGSKGTVMESRPPCWRLARLECLVSLAEGDRLRDLPYWSMEDLHLRCVSTLSGNGGGEAT